MKNGFCEYLLKKGRITEDQLERARSQVDILNLKTGLCSYAFGFMDPPKIQKIIGMQRRTGQKFGDIAIALGYLTPERPADYFEGLEPSLIISRLIDLIPWIFPSSS